MRRHPWRLPFGPAKAVKNRSRRFFIRCHPWRSPTLDWNLKRAGTSPRPYGLKIVPDDFLFAAIHGAHPSGQRFALLKIVPDDFLFAAIHGAHPKGQLKLLKIVPDDFLFAAIHGAHPKGQLKLLKIVPDDFFTSQFKSVMISA